MSDDRIYTEEDIAAAISLGLDDDSLAKMPQATYPTFRLSWGIIQISHQPRGPEIGETLSLDIYADSVLNDPDLEAAVSDFVVSSLELPPSPPGLISYTDEGGAPLLAASVCCSSPVGDPDSTAASADIPLDRNLVSVYFSDLLRSGAIGDAVPDVQRAGAASAG
jgi:hypothetical protein